MEAALRFGRSVNWEKAIPRTSRMRIGRQPSNDNNNDASSSSYRSQHCGVKLVANNDDEGLITYPFNQYQIVSSVVSAFDTTSNAIYQGLYNTCYRSTNASDLWKNSTYVDVNTRTGTNSTFLTYSDVGNQFRSSFVPQFQAFLTNTGYSNAKFASNSYNVYRADRAWFRELVGNEDCPYFGMGAGPNYDELGYTVLAIADSTNEEHMMFSPAIMAGFLASKLVPNAEKEEIHATLRTLFKVAPQVCVGDRRILWRYSAKQLLAEDDEISSFNYSKVVQNDYVTFPLGFSTRWIGANFYSRYAIW